MRSNQARRITGGALILLGLAFNKWLLEATVVSDGRIASTSANVIVVLVQLTLITVGLALLSGRRLAPHSTLVTWLLAGSSVVGALLLAEVAVRLLPGSRYLRTPPRYVVGERENRTSPNFTPDSLLGWRMYPSHSFDWIIDGRRTTYASNAQGFRSPQDLDVSESRPKIALTGDSFAFGSGVEYEETFVALLQDRHTDLAFYNLAMPGYGIDQMWMAFRHVVLPLNPQAVIVAFVDQDFERALTAYRVYEGLNKPTFVLDNGRLRPQTPEDANGLLTRFLETHSLIWAMGRGATRGLGYRWGLGDWWRVNAAILRQIANEAHAAALPVLFVRLPTLQRYDFPVLQQLMDSLSADYIDLAHPDSTPPGQIHIPADGHLNVRGHVYVTGYLDRWIGERLVERR